MTDITGQVQAESFTFVWKINEFSKKCIKSGECISSPVFEFGDFTNKTYWSLRLYPFGNTAEVTDYVSLYLYLLPHSKVSEYVCQYAISLIGDTKIDVSTQQKCSREIFFTDEAYGWIKFIERSKIYKRKTTLLKENVLTISCSVTELSVSRTCNVVNSITNEYESIYTTGDFSDVTIAIGDKTIKAHKAILSARSKVFSAMLKNDTIESSTNIITISDIEFEVMEKFLVFLYSGKVDDIKNFVKPLLVVANKYDASDLKLLCENVFLSSKNISNACEFVSIADLHNCYELKCKIIDHMIKNMTEIIKTTGFNELATSNPTLFKEIFCKLAEAKCEKNN